MRIPHRRTAIPVALSLLAAACSRSEPPPTVSWYREHADERRAMVERCAEDPGSLGKTPACINAKKAESIEGIGSFRDLPPMGLSGTRPRGGTVPPPPDSREK